VIFMRRDVVKGLTTAAAIWLTAAVGMACAAGLIVLGVALTVLHIVAATLIAPIVRRLPNASDRTSLTVRYVDGRGILRVILEVAGEMGYQTTIRSTQQVRTDRGLAIVAHMQFRGRPPLQSLVAQLTELAGVEGVAIHAASEEME